MQTADIQVIKDIPSYKLILKTVIKSQIQQLVEQLAKQTGEESVILTASVSDGSLSQLGSESGKVFLEDHDDIKSQFLEFCMKRQEQPKHLGKETQQQQLQDPGGQLMMVKTKPTRHSPGRGPRYSLSGIQATPTLLSSNGVSQTSCREKLPTNHGSYENRNIGPNESMKTEGMEGEEFLDRPQNKPSSVSGITPETDSADESTSDTEAIDPGVNIKDEVMANSELDLDIKDLMTQPDNGVTLDLQMKKLFDPSSAGGAQGNVADKASLVCRYCGKGFKNKRSYRQHEMRHSGVGRYSCSYCNKTSYTKAHHKRHEAMHSDKRTFVCSTSNCGKKFKTKDDLMRHQKREKRQLNFACEICGILWETRKELVDHLTKHTGVKGHVCETCGVSFRYRNNLSRHRKIHSQAPDSFKCDECGKCFSREGTLKEHSMICGYKSFYKCRHCDKGFKCERYLTLHEKRVHK